MYQRQPQILVKEDSDIVRAFNLFVRNIKLLILSVIIALALAFIYNSLALPVYNISALLLIKEEDNSPMSGDAEEFINRDLFGTNQGFQNELHVLKSSPVIEQTVRNLDLTIGYFQKDGFKWTDAYGKAPFRILLLQDHVQPVNVKFMVALHKGDRYTITAESKEVVFTNLYSAGKSYVKNNWSFDNSGKFGDLIETDDMAFVIERDSFISSYIPDNFVYSFVLSPVSAMTGQIRSQLDFVVVERDATVVRIDLKSASGMKGVDVVTELMNVYSNQNLNRKNHIADVTIEYIERQLSEISDSLSMTEDNLQYFRSSRQLLDVNDQASNISEQYMDLQNQMAELTTRKRYYDYLANHLNGNEDLSNIIVPTSMGVQDELLNEMVSQLIAAQNQRSNLIRNRQERNPLVQRLEIQIENTKKTIFENITAVQKTTEIAIDEMSKRINRVKAEISRIPVTQRQLGGIERNYRLNDAIYNYMLEKRAEAKISQASNLPDNLIIEPAGVTGIVSPDTRRNLLLAFVLGLMFPYAFLFIKGMVHEKIDFDERIDRLTNAPLLGKIPHNRRKTNNVVYEFQQSVIAEAYRALRTNIEFRFKDKPHKVILVSSSVEGDGKSLNALNLAMSYAQLGRYTILLDFDLRKTTSYFAEKKLVTMGLSSYFVDKVNLGEIIHPSPHNKLDYISTGPLPQNPVEILASDEIRELLSQLKEQYDCVVLDTSPLAQVSDAYLLMEYSDIRIIIARYNHTPKKVFHLVMEDLRQKNIDNLCVVLNDNRIEQNQYGYGYGYQSKKRKWLRF